MVTLNVHACIASQRSLQSDHFDEQQQNRQAILYFIIYPSITSGVSTMYHAITVHIVVGQLQYDA